MGVIDDSANRSRLAKLLKFRSTAKKGFVSFSEYVERMKEKQDAIYYIAGASLEEVEKSPFVERLVKKGYEVLYLTEAVDEYCISALPEFEGKKFQNVAKEGVELDEGESAKAKLESLKTQFEPLTKWMTEVALKDQVRWQLSRYFSTTLSSTTKPSIKSRLPKRNSRAVCITRRRP